MMVVNPEKLVEPFARAGADGITFHVEATENPNKVIDLIRSTGKQVGISLKPGTSLTTIEPDLEKVDLVLIMSVEAGFVGHCYLSDSSERIKKLKSRLNEMCLDRVIIEVDGGVKLNNMKEIVEAGADVLVAGSAVFGEQDPVQTIKDFYALI
ncbi:MAG: ribulose-phosphate 3-epimerase, partial [Nitrososphaerales archaeon]|nr:ribulose-phosphate 3-epimerase [Nitrososphaerales archaeon]